MQPLISCITPITEDRRHFIPALLDSFRSQSYTNKELIIVGDKYPETLTTPGEAIFCFDQGNDLSVGLKRNLAVSLSHGEYIAHFDSDDYSEPERLQTQLDTLRRTEKPVTGYHSIKVKETRIINGKANTTWKHTDAILGTSLFYSREWWSVHPFPDKQRGEDETFWREALKAGQAVSSEGFDFLTVSNHNGSVSGRVVIVGHGWEKA